jgi:hypothetical protein
MIHDSFIGVKRCAADDLLLALSQRSYAGGAQLFAGAKEADKQRLQLIGAVKDNRLTEIGNRMVGLVAQGITHHLACVLTAAAEIGCIQDAARVVALLRTSRSLRFRPPERTGREQCLCADQAHIKLARSGFKTDLGRLLGVYDAAAEVHRTAPQKLRTFCNNNFIDREAFITAQNHDRQLRKILDESRMTCNSEAKDESNLILALLCGLSDCLVEYEGSTGLIYKQSVREIGWKIARGSCVRGRLDNMILLPLFLRSGESQIGNYARHTGRFTLIKEAVEVSSLQVEAKIDQFQLDSRERVIHAATIQQFLS